MKHLVLAFLVLAGASAQATTRIHCAANFDDTPMVFKFAFEAKDQVAVLLDVPTEDGPMTMELPAELNSENDKARIYEVGFFMGSLGFQFTHDLFAADAKKKKFTAHVTSSSEGWEDEMDLNCELL